MTTDPIAHVVKDADAYLWSKSAFGAEFIDICVSLTSKHGCRMQLAAHIAILLVCIANLIQKSGHKLLSTEATFGLFALLTFLCHKMSAVCLSVCL